MRRESIKSEEGASIRDQADKEQASEEQVFKQPVAEEQGSMDQATREGSRGGKRQRSLVT
jgi:hypothetical protein